MEFMVESLNEQVNTLESYLDDERRLHFRTKESDEVFRQKCIKQLQESHFDFVETMKTRHNLQWEKSIKENKFMLTMLEQAYKKIVKNLQDENGMVAAALKNHKATAAKELSVAWQRKEIERQEAIVLQLQSEVSSAKDSVRKSYEAKMENLRESYECKLNALAVEQKHRELEFLQVKKKLENVKRKAERVNGLELQISDLNSSLNNVKFKLQEAENVINSQHAEIAQLEQSIQESKISHARKQSVAFRNRQREASLKVGNSNRSETETDASTIKSNKSSSSAESSQNVKLKTKKVTI